MKTEKTYLVTTNIHSFNHGIPAEIVDVLMCTPSPSNDITYDPRLCYHVRYSDGTEDHIPLLPPTNYQANNDYEIITFSDILNGNIPR